MQKYLTAIKRDAAVKACLSHYLKVVIQEICYLF